MTRRAVMRALAGVAAGLSVSRAQNAPPSVTPTKLADNLVEIAGAGANSVLLIADDGLLLVDGGLPDRSAQLLKVVAEQGQGRSVRVLFNTHWHLDHTGSNEALGQAGAKIMASVNTKRWLSTTVTVEAQNRTYQPRPAEAVPTEVIAAPGKMTFGKEVVEYGPLPPGHTNGDIYVRFPGPNILMVSDDLSVGRYPIMDYSTGGWIGGMIEATEVLLKLADANTRIIPGAGPMQTKADLQAEHDMLVTVKDRVQAAIRQGKGLTDIAAEAPTKEFDAKWGKPDLFLSMTFTGMMRHTHEIGGIL